MSENKKHLLPRDEDGSYSFQDFVNVVDTLRSRDGGCAWDNTQTLDSMQQFLIDETEELLSAVRNKDANNICEELGDIMFITLLYAAIADDEKLFSIDEVIDCGARKMIGRHPHIFKDRKFESREAFREYWASVKPLEKAARRERLEKIREEKYGISPSSQDSEES